MRGAMPEARVASAGLIWCTYSVVHAFIFVFEQVRALMFVFG